MELPRRVTRYVALNAGAGLATLALAGTLDRHAGFGRLWLFAAFTIVMTVSQLFPVFLLHQQESEGLHFEESFIAAMAFLLPPFPAILAVAISVGAGQLLQRLPAVKVAFNTGQLVTSTGLAFLAMEGVGLDGPLAPRKVVAVLVGAVVFLLVNRLLVTGVIVLIEGKPLRRELVSGLGVTLWIWPGVVFSGMMAGLVGSWHLWMLPLALVAMAALHLTYSLQFGATRAQQRMTGLLDAATNAHASVAVDSVRAAVLHSTRDLLSARAARFDALPPREGELGARLPLGGEELWLIAGGHRGAQTFDQSEQQLLDAIVAIAASALRNAALFEELERTMAERRRLFAHVTRAREEERRKIAEDIHDDSVQVMSAAAMRLNILGRRVTDPEGRRQLDLLEETVREAIWRLRSLIFELRPRVLDLEGLGPALRTYLERRAPEGLTWEVVDEQPEESDQEARTIAYRIAQEALANACRHAGATHVEVRVRAERGGLGVQIHDDGRGFSPSALEDEPGHLGMVAMRERAEVAGGWLRVSSASGEGTAVEFWIPAEGLLRPDQPVTIP